MSLRLRWSCAVTATALLVACARPAPAPSAASPLAGKRAEGREGMVSTSQQQASMAGVEILRAGGNAVDAAVAAAFALSVVDPSQTGLGGGGAATVYIAPSRTVDHLSFYGRAGERPEWAAADTGPRTSDRAGRGAATPGMVSGLLTLHEKHGRLPRARVIAPAIALARDGFIVSPLLARTIASASERVADEPHAAERFMPGGEPLRPGQRLVQPELAALLDLIAAAGADAFYRSAFAERLAYHVQERGGLITTQDLATYQSTWTRPLCTTWRGYTVLGAPPPLGGSVVLAMLHLAERAGITSARGYTETPDVATSFAQLIRIAQSDGQRWRGDPAVMSVPAGGVASAQYADTRSALLAGPLRDTLSAGDPWAADAAAPSGACAALDPYPAATRPPDAPRRGGSSGSDASLSAAIDDEVIDDAPSEDSSFTSHLSVVDAEGNAVSMTTTVGVLFGSGVWSDGVWLNSVGRNFDARTRGTNRYSNSTMAPTIFLDESGVRLVVGAAGSQYIQPATTQVSVRMLIFGEDPAMALAAPRVHPTWTSREVEVEPGFSPAVYGALVQRGFLPLSRVGDILFGGVHAVYVTPDGRRIGAADHRRDGFAAGQ